MSIHDSIDPHPTYTKYVVCRDQEVLFGDWTGSFMLRIREANRKCKDLVRANRSIGYFIFRVTTTLLREPYTTRSVLVPVKESEPLFSEWEDAMFNSHKQAETYGQQLIEYGYTRSCDIYLVTITRIHRIGVANIAYALITRDDVDTKKAESEAALQRNRTALT